MPCTLLFGELVDKKKNKNKKALAKKAYIRTLVLLKLGVNINLFHTIIEYQQARF